MLLVQGKIHHWSTGVDLEAQPSVDLGKDNCAVSSVAVSVLRSQQKSSTKTKPQSMRGKIK